MGKYNLRVGQLNLQGAQVASRELNMIAKDRELNVVAVQEQYQSENICYMQNSQKSEAAILVFNTKLAITFLSEISNDYCCCIHLQIGNFDFYLVSAYFKYSHDIEPHLLQIERILERLKGKRIIICADTNVHSLLWFSETRQYVGRGHEAEERRTMLENLIAQHALIIHNVEGQPATFSGPAGSSNIDVTLSTGVYE
ncbi:Retrovirus-related Pol polyprotein from type-1 retrotransposable element R1 [Eumeta japonica]|uniref:Retrovirus-related Pol polyprotein from type-1 retrotransposable element R1 n=1 Tax=Eumeta variegata TaxID=151549 RepID=A0A4C1ZM05_EUMVA|nr:Retrovirus-related Pol polyprotein from type-1 retrotransposable element R1 [Eumeta japonica]